VNELQSQLTLALIVPYILQWLKAQKWFPLITMAGGRINAIVAAVVAAGAGLGIAISFNDQTGILTVSGLTWMSLWPAIQHAVLQFMMQHAAYRTLIAPAKPGAEQVQERAVPKA
jgi:hypothetical protein